MIAWRFPPLTSDIFFFAAWPVHHSSVTRKYPEVFFCLVLFYLLISVYACVWRHILMDVPASVHIKYNEVISFLGQLFLHTIVRMFSFNQRLSFQTAQLKLKKSPSTITLISRRCTRRLGTMSQDDWPCFLPVHISNLWTYDFNMIPWCFRDKNVEKRS